MGDLLHPRSVSLAYRCSSPFSRTLTAVRLVTLLVPLCLTALLSLNLARMTMISGVAAAPSTSALVNILALSLLGILYLALETTIGWQPSWWPRVMERKLTTLFLANTSSVLPPYPRSGRLHSLRERPGVWALHAASARQRDVAHRVAFE